jgi:hypothetical protein
MQFTRSTNRTAVAGLVIYSACLLAAMALFALNQFSQAEIKQEADLAAQAKHYAGTVVIPDAGGRCRRLEFNNNTGGFREGSKGSCRDDTPDQNSTEGRISAIRDAFVKR